MPTKSKARIVHAQIKNPVLLRKTILESSISSIENLKILKNIKQIKKRKGKLKAELRTLSKEFKDLLFFLEETLPKPSEVGINPQKESEKEIKKVIKTETKKRNSQKKLIEKTTEKNENPFEQKDKFDFDIEELKNKIGEL
jgi:hypothetical protein